MLMTSATRFSSVMTTPTPTRFEPVTCQGSIAECFLRALAAVAVIPVALWALSDPVLAAALGASIAIVVALTGQFRGHVQLFEGKD